MKLDCISEVTSEMASTAQATASGSGGVGVTERCAQAKASPKSAGKAIRAWAIAAPSGALSRANTPGYSGEDGIASTDTYPPSTGAKTADRSSRKKGSALRTVIV